MPGDWQILAACALGAGGVWAFWSLSRNPDKAAKNPVGKTEGERTGARLAVQPGAEVLTQLRLQGHIDGCRERMGFDAALFQNDCLPVILQAAEWAQLLPASESHHHAQPGGLVTHMMESAVHALRFRQGYLLPVGAAPEDIPERRHRWTYAVFLAALLHDIGRPMADLQIPVWRANKPSGAWQPLAGSLIDQGLTHYSVSFEITRDYDLHKKLPVILLQRLVPPHVLAWLAADAQLMTELTSYLSGDESYKGALCEIVTLADSESVRSNLLLGPRTRFASAKAEPLIERLMQALRLMLEEGRLSLNRAGAHGWVHDGHIWFVSKRLADDVRQFLTERESSEGIPGKDKNDRLFDTWQEYGALRPTPDNRAVWHVMVRLDEGWEQRLTVLCFALDKLFASPAAYPESMRGKVIADFSEAAGIESNPDTETVFLESQESVAAIDADQLELPNLNRSAPVTTPTESPVRSNAALPPLRAPAPAAVLRDTKPQQARNEGFLDDADAASPRAAKPRPPPQAAALKPIAPAGQTAAPRIGGPNKKEPTGAAIRFMRWIQEGLADGSLSYNRADAMIHFVEEGMMLVSPVIFRRFAELFGEEGDGTPSDRAGSKLGTGIQRQLTNAGWHLVSGEKKSNIQRYLVIGANGEGKKLISGVVILDPAQYVNPLPQVNPVIVRFEQPIEHV